MPCTLDAVNGDGVEYGIVAYVAQCTKQELLAQDGIYKKLHELRSAMRLQRKEDCRTVLRDAIEGNQLENVRALYEASFPRSEKKPFQFIVKKREEGFFDILAIEDGQGRFCGLAIMMLSGGLALLDYLAIAPDCQGTGLGSRTLKDLRERYGEDKIVVEIESTAGLDPVAGITENALGHRREKAVQNAGDRLRRKAFYLRNGMVPMDYRVNLFGVEMEVLTYGRLLTYEEYHAIYTGILPEKLAGKVTRASG